MRHVVLSALLLATGCDGLFGLTHIREQGSAAGDDDAAVTDAITDGGGGRTDTMADAYVQKTCVELGYTITIGATNTHYRGSGQTMANWDAAQQDCEDDAAPANQVHTHLAVIGDDTEASMVFAGVVGSAGDYWVGLTDRKVSNNFKWVTDESTGGYPQLTEPPWGTGEPSGGAGEDCVIVSPAAHFFDKTCTDLKVYACECDSHPVNPANF